MVLIPAKRAKLLEAILLDIINKLDAKELNDLFWSAQASNGFSNEGNSKTYRLLKQHGLLAEPTAWQVVPNGEDIPEFGLIDDARIILLACRPGQFIQGFRYLDSSVIHSIAYVREYNGNMFQDLSQNWSYVGAIEVGDTAVYKSDYGNRHTRTECMVTSIKVRNTGTTTYNIKVVKVLASGNRVEKLTEAR